MTDEVITRWYRITGHYLLKREHPFTGVWFEDLQQEGVVHAWLKTGEKRDPVTYGGVVARRRIGHLLSGRALETGNELDGGKRSYDMARKFSRAEAKDNEEGEEDEVPDSRETIPDIADGAILTMEVRRAIAGLGERQRQFAWLIADGHTVASAGAELGLARHAAGKVWEGVREALRPLLAEAAA